MKNLLSIVSVLALGIFLQACSGVGLKETEAPVYEEEENPKGCPGPNGFVAEGMTVTMYRVATPTAGSHCESEIRACLNGVLTGTYQNLMCNEPQLLPTIDTNPIAPQSRPQSEGEGASSSESERE